MIVTPDDVSCPYELKFNWIDSNESIEYFAEFFDKRYSISPDIVMEICGLFQSANGEYRVEAIFSFILSQEYRDAFASVSSDKETVRSLEMYAGGVENGVLKVNNRTELYQDAM